MEESLREAACNGNVDAVNLYIKSGVDVNSQNAVNGWTALHWAVKRDQKEIIKILLHAGAKSDIESKAGQTPFQLSKTLSNLGSKSVKDHSTINDEPDFVPNYLKNPVFPYSSEKNSSNINTGLTSQNTNDNLNVVGESSDKKENGFYFQPNSLIFVNKDHVTPCGLCVIPEYIILRVRVKNEYSLDFIEVSIDRNFVPTFDEFSDILHKELNLCLSDKIKSIRKLPCTVIRSSLDIKRLTDYQMLEVVIDKTVIP